jgi:hypothetical protein
MSIHEGGEYVIGYEINRDRKDGKWYGKTTLAGMGSVGKDHHEWVEWAGTPTRGGTSTGSQETTLDGTGSAGKDHQGWVEWTTRTSTGGGVSTSRQTFEPGKRVELIRHRVSKVSDSSKIEDPSAGFMIWLEPIK